MSKPKNPPRTSPARKSTPPKTAPKTPVPSKPTFPVFWIALGVIAVIGIGIAIVSSGSDDSTKSSRPSGKATSREFGKIVVDGSALARLPDTGTDPAVGTPIPTINGQNFAGQAETIAPNGKAQMILFLAHWCSHCNAEAPRLVDYLKRNGVPAGVEITIVPTGSDEQAPNWPPSQWVKDMNIADLATLVDSLDAQAAQAFGLTSYPYIVMVDKFGDVVDRRAGEQKDGFFTAAFKSLAEGRTIPANA